jgi:hypothetical protein
MWRALRSADPWTTLRNTQVVYFYSGKWWNFSPALTEKIRLSWNKTNAGNMQIKVEQNTDQDWFDYIAKYKTKEDYLDAFDWENTHLTFDQAPNDVA